MQRKSCVARPAPLPYPQSVLLKKIAIAFGPIIGFLLFLYALKPSEEASASSAPPPPAVPSVPSLPSLPDLPNVVKAGGSKILITGNDKQVRRRCPPNAKVILAGSANEVTLEGECGAIAVTGNDNEVRLERAEKLVLAGNANELSIDRTGPISIHGNDNDVRYGSGLDPSSAPSITEMGNDNDVKRGLR